MVRNGKKNRNVLDIRWRNALEKCGKWMMAGTDEPTVPSLWTLWRTKGGSSGKMNHIEDEVEMRTKKIWKLVKR